MLETDLGNEVLHDVGRVIAGGILAADHDCMGEALPVLLQRVGYQVSQTCLATPGGSRNEEATWAGAAQVLQGCSACSKLRHCLCTNCMPTHSCAVFTCHCNCLTPVGSHVVKLCCGTDVA